MTNDGRGLEAFSPEVWIKLPTGELENVGHKALFQPLPKEHEYVLQVSGRKKISFWRKINPFWWITNDWDPVPPMWYMPLHKNLIRTVMWWFRNPFHNFGRYVLGVGDRNYKFVYTRADGYIHRINPDGGHEDVLVGWECGYIELQGGARLPWIAYGSFGPPTTKFYMGWQPTGFAGLKFNGYAILIFPLVFPLFIWMLFMRVKSVFYA